MRALRVWGWALTSLPFSHVYKCLILFSMNPYSCTLYYELPCFLFSSSRVITQSFSQKDGIFTILMVTISHLHLTHISIIPQSYLSHMQIYKSMQVCKYMEVYVSVQVCKHESMQVCKYANMQVCKYSSIKVCKFASMQECKYASMWVCKYVSMQ